MAHVEAVEELGGGVFGQFDGWGRSALALFDNVHVLQPSEDLSVNLQTHWPDYNLLLKLNRSYISYHSPHFNEDINLIFGLSNGDEKPFIENKVLLKYRSIIIILFFSYLYYRWLEYSFVTKYHLWLFSLECWILHTIKIEHIIISAYKK